MEGKETSCLTGTDFQFCKMKTVLQMDDGDGRQQNNVNVHKVSELKKG